jgi:hypothetical protein
MNPIVTEANNSYWHDLESEYVYTSFARDVLSENETYERTDKLTIHNITEDSNQIVYNIDGIRDSMRSKASCQISIDDIGTMTYLTYIYDDLSQRWTGGIYLLLNLPLDLAEIKHHYGCLFFLPLEHPLFAFKTDYDEADLILETSHNFNGSIHQGYHVKFNYTQTSSITQENHTKEFSFSDKGELLSYHYNKTTTFIDYEYSYASETNVTLEDIILKTEDTKQTGIYQLFYVQFAILVLIAEIVKKRKRKSNNSQTS